MRPPRLAPLAALALALALPAPATAKVGTLPLDEAARDAAVIAVVAVDLVAKVEGLALARATVTTPVKGALAGEHLAFIAAPTWPCDVSAAKKGERALVILELLPAKGGGLLADPAKLARAAQRHFNEDLPLYRLAHAGRGRFPLATHDGATWALAAPTELRLPPALAPRPLPRLGPAVPLAALAGHLEDTVAATLPVAVALEAAHAQRTEHDLLLHLTATLTNRSGAPITVRTNFGGPFDALLVVVAGADGRELARQGYTHHQSPYAQDQPHVLKPGPTTQALVFPVAALKDAGGPLTLRLVGGLPGTGIRWGLRSQAVTVTPPR
jgi:hypothetical protein